MCEMQSQLKSSTLIGVFVIAVITFAVIRMNFSADDATHTLPVQSEAPIAQLKPSESAVAKLTGSESPQLQNIAPVEKESAVAPLAPLNIRLLSTMVAGDKSSVIILLPGEVERIFNVGDIIQPGVKLHHVDADAMVVERAGGRLVRIPREHGERLNGQGTGNPDAATDISTLMTRAKLVLHHDGGKADGFLISDIVVDSIYHKSGLYNGDIIRKINGTQLLRADQVDVLYNGMRSSVLIELEILRAGNVKQLSYGVR